MSHYYVSPGSISKEKALIRGEEAHHIRDVMRMRCGDAIVIFDGTGNRYKGRIESLDDDAVSVQILETYRQDESRAASITLIQAIPKKDKMDYIVEKSTELGVSCIQPVFADRTVVSWDENKAMKMRDRWTKIAVASSKQSGRSELPVVKAIIPCREALVSAGSDGISLMATLNDESRTLKSVLDGHCGRRATIAIGPEGDFTPREVADAIQAGFKLISLGTHVLKSDTAGLYVLSVLNHLYS